jgi:DNA-binding PadR family transcriptional regulator
MSIDGLVTADVTETELIYTINEEGRAALAAPRCQ